VRLWKSGFREKVFPWGLFPVLAFIAHTFSIFLRGFSLDSCPIQNLYEAGMFIGWTLSLASLFALFVPKLRFLTAFLSPLLFLLGAIALIPAFATFSFLAYGAWGIAAATALMYLIQQRDLKLKKSRALTSILPPVQRIKNLAMNMILAGILFLSVGLWYGIRGHHEFTGTWIGADFKIIWALALWAYFITLWIFCRMSLFRDRILAWCIICGFLFIFFTFWPTSALSSTHRQKAQTSLTSPFISATEVPGP
jgi:ABC-type transport system involved in cytochrome c biogenesis permease subunit